MRLSKEHAPLGRDSGPVRIAAIVTCVQIALFFLFGRPHLGDGYLEGQWALDYSGGFVRRGLFGTVVSAFVPARDFLTVVRPIFFLVALTALAVSTWRFARLASRSGLERSDPTAYELLIYGLMAVNPLFWSFFANSVGRFDQVFFLLAVYIVGLCRRSPRAAAWWLLATAPLLGAMHELYLLLYYPLLLGFVATSGLWERPNRRVLVLGAAVGICTLGALYVAPLFVDSDPTAASLAISEKMNGPGMEHAEAAISISRQRVGAATKAVFETGPVDTSLLELIVTTGFFCVAAFVTGGPLAQRRFAGTLGRPIVRPALLGLGCYAFLCIIASDWGRLFMDVFMLLIALAPPELPGNGSGSDGSGQKRLLDIFPSRTSYVVVAALLFGSATNLPLTKIPLGELLMPFLKVGDH